MTTDVNWLWVLRTFEEQISASVTSDHAIIMGRVQQTCTQLQRWGERRPCSKWLRLSRTASLHLYHRRMRARENNLLTNYVHTLDLNYCQNISDVSALGNVHTLYLVCCQNISDVSALGRVHTLNLSDCPNISDVSALGRVHTLDLSYCPNVRDVSALGHVHTLNLRNCQNITDVSALDKVSELVLPHGKLKRRNK